MQRVKKPGCWAIDDDGYLSAIRFGSAFWDLPEPELMFELALICKTLLTEKDKVEK